MYFKHLFRKYAKNSDTPAYGVKFIFKYCFPIRSDINKKLHLFILHSVELNFMLPAYRPNLFRNYLRHIQG